MEAGVPETPPSPAPAEAPAAEAPPTVAKPVEATSTEATSTEVQKPAVHTVKGDLAAALESAGDVQVSGSVCAGVNVRVGGSLHIAGTIESSTVAAGGDLVADGGIVGRGKGRYTATRSLTARSILAAQIEAGGNVTASVEIANSRLIVGGALVCESGHLYGGHVTVNGGLRCGTLGSPGESETIIEVGLDESLRRLSAQHAGVIETNQNRIKRVRSQVEPLLAQQRALTPKQKETATELLYEAGELEERTLALIRQLRESVGASLAQARPEVTIALTIHPGVVLRFPGLEARFDRAVKGPIRIFKDGKGASARIVGLDLKDNAEVFIKYIPHSDPALTALFRALVVPKPKSDEGRLAA